MMNHDDPSYDRESGGDVNHLQELYICNCW
nr:MAG TPA: leucine rich repeat protein [Caudoviricetes sp.]